MQDTMKSASWVPELRVGQQPLGKLPSDTRLHCLPVALLGIQVQVGAPLHAQLWGDHRQESLAQLQRTGVWAPDIVWMAAPPRAAYWRWAKTSQAPLVTVTAAMPPFLWIAIAPGGGGKFPVPGRVCGAQMPGAPTQGGPPLLPRYLGGSTSRASPGPAHQPQVTSWGRGPSGATQPGYLPPTKTDP